MQGAYVLTCALYGAGHDLRLKILGTCKPSNTPLRSISYHSVAVYSFFVQIQKHQATSR